jgi:hypothetical protein
VRSRVPEGLNSPLPYPAKARQLRLTGSRTEHDLAQGPDDQWPSAFPSGRPAYRARCGATARTCGFSVGILETGYAGADMPAPLVPREIAGERPDGDPGARSR